MAAKRADKVAETEVYALKRFHLRHIKGLRQRCGKPRADPGRSCGNRESGGTACSFLPAARAGEDRFGNIK
jgi:hypothetical protein